MNGGKASKELNGGEGEGDGDREWRGEKVEEDEKRYSCTRSDRVGWDGMV